MSDVDWKARAEAAEKERDAHLEASADYLVELTDVKAELARLREPVTEGEVGDMVKRLLMVAVIIKGEKAQVATDAADLLTRLAARVVVEVRSTADLDREELARFIDQTTHFITTEVCPGMDPALLKREGEAHSRPNDRGRR